MDFHHCIQLHKIYKQSTHGISLFPGCAVGFFLLPSFCCWRKGIISSVATCKRSVLSGPWTTRHKTSLPLSVPQWKSKPHYPLLHMAPSTHRKVKSSPCRKFLNDVRGGLTLVLCLLSHAVSQAKQWARHVNMHLCNHPKYTPKYRVISPKLK